jgi:hypothetical protein
MGGGGGGGGGCGGGVRAIGAGAGGGAGAGCTAGGCFFPHAAVITLGATRALNNTKFHIARRMGNNSCGILP